MVPNEAYKITKIDLANSLLGGGISFLTNVFLLDIADTLLRHLLVSLGIIGVSAFDSFTIAKPIIIFGVVYLTCGFFGGLYTGYKCEERLNIFLLITASLGFISFISLAFFLGRLSLPIDYTDILIPALAGNFIGVFLGGYTINWSSKEEEEESSVLTSDVDEENPTD